MSRTGCPPTRAVVGITTALVGAAAVVGYTKWTLTDRAFARDTDEVVRIATEVSEATATFSPSDPTGSVEKAASMMAPERADAFRAQFAPDTADMAKRRVTAKAATISAGLEALAPSAATVAVLIRGTQTEAGQQPSTAVLALRVALSKVDGAWKVVDVAPINAK